MRRSRLAPFAALLLLAGCANTGGTAPTEGGRPITLNWSAAGLNDAEGRISFPAGEPSGTGPQGLGLYPVRIALPGGLLCHGNIRKFGDSWNDGSWLIRCSNGLAAEGSFRRTGGGGLIGRGQDNRDRPVAFMVPEARALQSAALPR